MFLVTVKTLAVRRLSEYYLTCTSYENQMNFFIQPFLNKSQPFQAHKIHTEMEVKLDSKIMCGLKNNKINFHKETYRIL